MVDNVIEVGFEEPDFVAHGACGINDECNVCRCFGGQNIFVYNGIDVEFAVSPRRNLELPVDYNAVNN